MYTCICGREFTSPQAFNGHKSHCEKHQINKHGSLEFYLNSNKTRAEAISKSMRAKQIKRISLEKFISEKHKCENCNKVMYSIYGSGRFCSKKCANSRKLTDLSKEQMKKTRQKTLKSKQKIKMDEYYLNPKRCVVCKKELPYEKKHRKTCSKKCLSIVNKINSVKAGCVSSKKRVKRSKNEILFCELCEQYFGKENVLHNVPMFNGWDADVIILNIKLAILWNGVWHYKKITKSHNLKQVQNRDLIKLKEIKKNMYTPYIIEDYGKYNETKVRKEFETLLNYLRQHELYPSKTLEVPLTQSGECYPYKVEVIGSSPIGNTMLP